MKQLSHDCQYFDPGCPSCHQIQYHKGDGYHMAGDTCRRIGPGDVLVICSMCRSRHPMDERHPVE